jgi:hypothetical protein
MLVRSQVGGIVARARAAREDCSTGIKAPEAKVLQKYVSLVSRLPFVEEVRAEPGYEGVQIWTVIDAEPFEFEVNKQIYQAELDAANAVPNALVLFRLINRREYSEDSVGYVLPADDRIAWQRAG